MKINCIISTIFLLIFQLLVLSCSNSPTKNEKTILESSSTIHARPGDTLMTDTSRSMTSGLGNDAGSNEALLIKNIQSSIAEIELSQLAKAKAIDKDVKSLAVTMIRDHTNMLNELRALAKTQKVNVSLKSENAKDIIKAKEKTKGKNFDKMWVLEMLAMHEMTIDETQDRANSTRDADIKNMLNKHLSTMKLHRDILASLSKKLDREQ